MTTQRYSRRDYRVTLFRRSEVYPGRFRPGQRQRYSRLMAVFANYLRLVMKRYSPVRTGRLRSSINVVVASNLDVVATMVFYGRFVRRHNSFIRRTVAAGRRWLVRRLERALTLPGDIAGETPAERAERRAAARREREQQARAEERRLAEIRSRRAERERERNRSRRRNRNRERRRSRRPRRNLGEVLLAD